MPMDLLMEFTTMSRRRRNDLWDYKPTDKDMDAVAWCMRNGIFVSLLPANKFASSFYIEISVQGKMHKSPNSFNASVSTEKLYEYYNYYYNKKVNGIV